MLRPCSSAISISAERCCKAWFCADRLTELLARLQVFEGQRLHRLHRPHRLGADCGNAGLDDAFDDREGLAGLAQNIAARNLDPAQRDLGGVRTVAHRIGAAGHTTCRGVDEKEADPVGLVALARDAGADDEFLGAVAVQHNAFGAVQHPAAGLGFCCRQHVGEVVARLPLAMREGELQIASGDLRQGSGLLCGIAGEPQRRPSKHDRRQIGFERERPAEGFHDQHRLDRPAAEPAMLLGKRQAEEAQFGVLPPEIGAPPLGLRQIAAAGGEVVTVGKQPVDAVAQQPLLLGQIKIH